MGGVWDSEQGNIQSLSARKWKSGWRCEPRFSYVQMQHSLCFPRDCQLPNESTSSGLFVLNVIRWLEQNNTVYYSLSEQKSFKNKHTCGDWVFFLKIWVYHLIRNHGAQSLSAWLTFGGSSWVLRAQATAALITGSFPGRASAPTWSACWGLLIWGSCASLDQQCLTQHLGLRGYIVIVCSWNEWMNDEII